MITEDPVYAVVKDELAARDVENKRKSMERDMAGEVEGIYVRLTLTQNTRTVYIPSRFPLRFFGMLGTWKTKKVWTIEASRDIERPTTFRPWCYDEPDRLDNIQDYDIEDYGSALFDYETLVKKYSLLPTELVQENHFRAMAGMPPVEKKP